MTSVGAMLQQSLWARSLSPAQLQHVEATLVERRFAAMFNPYLYPATGLQLRISQEEIGYLSDLSRQRVNTSLKALEQAGVLQAAYGEITVLGLSRLRNFGG